LSAVEFDGKRLFRIEGFTPAFHEAGRAMYAAASANTKREKQHETEIWDFESPESTQDSKRSKRKRDATLSEICVVRGA
jgi:hypothetical protein